MKLTLRFKHYDSTNYPCAVFVDTENQTALACAIAKTWAEAEAEAIEKARAQLNAGPVPEQKEVFI